MTDKYQVIQTGAAQAAAAKLSTAAQADFILEVASRAYASQQQMDTTLRNLIGEAKTLAEQANAAADLLGDFEKGQLEDAFTKFLTTSGLNGVLSAMAFSIDGQTYSLSSVLDVLVNADAIADEQFTYQGNDLKTGVYTLQDGYAVLMEYVKSPVVSPDTGLETGEIKFEGTTANWRGLTVTDSFVFRPQKQTQTLFGSAVDVVTGMELVRRTHIKINIMPMLQAATGVTLTAPDLNNDGIVGEQPAP